MNFNSFVWLWAAMALAVLTLAIYRNLAGIHSDESFHVLGPEVQREARTIARLQAMDRWGQILTIVVAAYGYGLLLLYLYLRATGHRF